MEGSVKIREFKDKISKGLGSAILFLKNNPEKAHKYFNAIRGKTSVDDHSRVF
jgi:hypothetical protein